MIGTAGVVRSVPPPTVVGSAANAAFGALFELLVEVTKLMPDWTEVGVQPAGKLGAVTASKLSLNVWIIEPIWIGRTKLVGPRVLVTLTVKFTAAPHGVPAGIVKLIWLLTVPL